MVISNRHIRYIKILSFILMLVLMVVLNNQQEKSHAKSTNETETNITYDYNISGTTPLNAKVPENMEGALPIKLISNPASNFLDFVNTSHEFKNQFRIRQWNEKWINISHRIQKKIMIAYIITTRNKDIM